MSAGRKRAKKVSLAHVSPGIELVAADVRDPYEPEKTIRVAKNARVHPLDHMEAQNVLTEGQKAAGDRFLQIFDRAEIGGARAIDYSRVKVDVSFTYAGLDESVASATKQLAEIYHAIGPRPYALLVAIIGMRKAPFDLARMPTGGVNREICAHVTASFKEALDDLARHFGVAVGRGKRVPPYERKIQPLTRAIAIRVEDGRIVLADA